MPIAAGEGSGTYRMAEDLILHGGIQFVQIDVGRIGGITDAFRVRQLAEQRMGFSMLITPSKAI